MSCSNQLYITLFIVLIFILIFINYKVCKYNKSYNLNKIDIIEGFSSRFTGKSFVYGTDDKDTSKYFSQVLTQTGFILSEYKLRGRYLLFSYQIRI